METSIDIGDQIVLQYNCKNAHSMKNSVHLDKIDTVRSLQLKSTTKVAVVQWYRPRAFAERLIFAKTDEESLPLIHQNYPLDENNTQ
jgi:hypothetical protein